MNSLKLIHPAAISVVDASRLQDRICGDGTTSVVVIIGTLLEEATKLLSRGLQPATIIEGFQKSHTLIREMIESYSLGKRQSETNEQSDVQMVRKVFYCALATKKIMEPSAYCELLLSAISAILSRKGSHLAAEDFSRVVLLPIPGEDVSKSHLIPGVVGMSSVPTLIKNKTAGRVVAFYGSPFRLTTTDKVQVLLKTPSELSEFQKSEFEYLNDAVEVMSTLEISMITATGTCSDELMQLCNSHNIMIIHEISSVLMNRILESTRSTLLMPHQVPSEQDIGVFEEANTMNMGNQTYWKVITTTLSEVTIILHGATEHLCEELKRHGEDALKSANCAWGSLPLEFMCGGGSFEIFASMRLSQAALSTPDVTQPVIGAYGRACETFVSILCENAGIDPNETVARLKHLHKNGDIESGLHMLDEDYGTNTIIANMRGSHVFELCKTKQTIFDIATKTVCDLLSVSVNLSAK